MTNVNSRLRFCALAWIACAALLTGCAEDALVHQLDEREANAILVVLESRGIPARKLMEEGRVVTWQVLVPARYSDEARKILVDFELPKPKSTRLFEVFKESGMIPTQSEEKAKMLVGIQGEIEEKLKLIPGVVGVHAQVVIPDKEAIRDVNEVKPQPMASVILVYKLLDGKLPFKPTDVQQAVASSVEGLTPDRVTVLSYEHQPLSRLLEASRGPQAAAGAAVPTREILGIKLVYDRHNITRFTIVMIGLGVLVALLLVFTIVFAAGRVSTRRQLRKALAENLAYRKARTGMAQQPEAD